MSRDGPHHRLIQPPTLVGGNLIVARTVPTATTHGSFGYDAAAEPTPCSGDLLVSPKGPSVALLQGG